MTEFESKEQEERLIKFRKLDKIKSDLYLAVDAVTKNDPEGPCQQGLFTGNTRETRRIKNITIKFTKTLDGVEIEKTIDNLFIEAWKFGRALEFLLKEKLKLVKEEIDKL